MKNTNLVIVSLALFSLLLSGFVSTNSAFAHGYIDQIHTAGTIPWRVSGTIGQTFTPTVDNLIGINVGLASRCSDTWNVLIRQGTIAGPILGNVIHVVTPTLTQHIDFPTLSLTPHNTYVIQIISSTGACEWNLSLDTTYPNGDAIIGSIIPGGDFNFATYYQHDADGDGIPDETDPCPTDPINLCNIPANLYLVKNSTDISGTFYFDMINSTGTTSKSITTTIPVLDSWIGNIVTQIMPDTWTFTEIVPSGWDLSYSDCLVNGNSVGTSNVVVSGGDYVICMFNNTSTLVPPLDSDGDGIPDETDECPNDPTNTCNEPPNDDTQKKSCEALEKVEAKENGNHKGNPKAQDNNNCN